MFEVCDSSYIISALKWSLRTDIHNIIGLHRVIDVGPRIILSALSEHVLLCSLTDRLSRKPSQPLLTTFEPIWSYPIKWPKRLSNPRGNSNSAEISIKHREYEGNDWTCRTLCCLQHPFRAGWSPYSHWRIWSVWSIGSVGQGVCQIVSCLRYNVDPLKTDLYCQQLCWKRSRAFPCRMVQVRHNLFDWESAQTNRGRWYHVPCCSWTNCVGRRCHWSSRICVAGSLDACRYVAH